MTGSDYRSTVRLPRTDFPMRGRLPEREPDMMARWEKMDLWGRLRRDARGRTPYTLHDGPPYANGPIHIGTALNKILKDIANRSRQMDGRDAHYIPGWDCHGLPIEWQIEQDYRKRKISRDDVPIDEFRRQCRAFADRWISVQMADFQRLFVLGDWDHRYLTMSFEAEARIVREIGRFLLDGSLYRGLKPVMWSPVEKTALAEAEVEYHDIVSTAAYVRFPVAGCMADGPVDAVIWTTTPWTLPGNRAMAFGPEIQYGVFVVTEPGPSTRRGDRLLVARARAEAVRTAAGIGAWDEERTFPGSVLDGTIARHPLADQGYGFDVPLLAGSFVDTLQGTGLVHIAPGHGEDDFVLGQQAGLPVPETVKDDGTYASSVPMLAGQHVFRVEKDILGAIRAKGRLLATERYEHSYPHSWRSKKPVIFRATPQWFISMEHKGLRASALAAIDATRWIPSSGRNRIRGMIENRPDWCVSRQRAWGVPIPVFVDRRTGEPLRDPEVVERVARAVAEEGADAWFTRPPEEFLGPGRDPERFEQVTDILDVWFDSGCTHAFALEGNPTQSWPADLYLEGTDQHRGWFQSSLLEACGTRGEAPYRSVLTHGFVLDGEGRKMSKSAGNVVRPQEIHDRHGTDILRLWVASSDVTEDLRIGDEILKGVSDSYRRYRNTLRFLLGNLHDHDGGKEAVEIADLPALERWVLSRLAGLDALRRTTFDTYAFHVFYRDLHTFCANDLSSFYFDVRKDSLYCDRPEAPVRRSARTVLAELHGCLTAWLAPVLSFTAEEAWLARNPGDDESVHLRQFPRVPEDWRDPELEQEWDAVRSVRTAVTGALEAMRREKLIGSSLEAAAVVHVDDARLRERLSRHDLAQLAIASAVEVSADPAPRDAYQEPGLQGVAVQVGVASGTKCARCWRVLPEVGRHDPPDLCRRCCEAV